MTELCDPPWWLGASKAVSWSCHVIIIIFDIFENGYQRAKLDAPLNMQMGNSYANWHFLNRHCCFQLHSVFLLIHKYTMFRIQFPGDVNVKKRLTDKFVSAKEQIQRNSKEFVTNSNVLEILLDSYFGGNSNSKTTIRNAYVATSKDSATEKIFMTTKSSLQRCIEIAHDHARLCNSQLQEA